jgi:hypothetical protein
MDTLSEHKAPDDQSSSKSTIPSSPHGYFGPATGLGLPTPIGPPASPFDPSSYGRAALGTSTTNNQSIDPQIRYGSAGPSDSNGKPFMFQLNAQRRAVSALCDKAAQIELNDNPQIYVDLFGADVQWALTLLHGAGISSSTGTKYAWITINPEYERYTLSQQWGRILGRLGRFLRLSWIQKWWVAIEQREETPKEPDGLHIHMILDRGKYVPAHVRRDLLRNFLEICGNEKHIYVVDLKEKHFLRKLHYITGHKREDQGTKPQNDKIMRQQLGIPDLMTNENPSPIYEIQEQQGTGDDDEKEGEVSDDDASSSSALSVESMN